MTEKRRVIWSGISKAFGEERSEEAAATFRAVLVDGIYKPHVLFEVENGTDAMGAQRWRATTDVPAQFVLNAARIMGEEKP